MERLTFILSLTLLRLSIWVDHRVVKGLIKEAFVQEERTRNALGIRVGSPWN